MMSTTTTAKQTEKSAAERSRSKLVPELRFREFDGEWVKNKLIDWSLVVLDGDRGSNYPSGDEFQSEGYCLFMNAKNVTKAGFSFEHKMFITKEKDEILRKGKLKREDLVLTTRGSVGHIAYYDQSVPFDNLRINSGMVLIRNENNVISSKFIYINFFTPNLIRQVSTISFGSAQPQLTVKEINKFKFNLPSLPEQQKIASFLSAVDKKIQQLTTKKELLEQYKKGVMQQLFSGQLRFKPDLSGVEGSDDGKDFPDWEEKRLGEVFEINAGGDVKKENARKVKDDIFKYPIYANSEKRKGLYGYSDLYKVDFDCVTVTGRGALGIANARKEKFYPIVRLLVLKPRKKSDIKFFENLINQLNIFCESTGVPQLTGPQISTYKVKFPCLKEQQKIATYLSGIDTKIESVHTQITQTQRFKKGLLQKMFV